MDHASRIFLEAGNPLGGLEEGVLDKHVGWVNGDAVRSGSDLEKQVNARKIKVYFLPFSRADFIVFFIRVCIYAR